MIMFRKKSEAEASASYSTGRRLPQLPSLNRNGEPSDKKGWASKVSKGLLLVAGLAILAGFAGGWLGATVQNQKAPASLSNETKAQYISNESELISEIAQDVGQSVVSIDVVSEVSVPSFFGAPQTQQQASAGTGFIISSDGVIVTNRHVVPADATTVSVTLADGTKYDDVQVLGRSSASSSLDVAFLKIKSGDLDGKKLPKVTLADSSKVQVGDKVVAIGNALGQFQNTVTAGIISGYGRDVVASSDGSGEGGEALTDLFQTDAAINQGNSGGPLVNINGAVIGINTAIAGGADNIGFAIPINDVKGLISSVLNTGELKQSYLGVRYVSLTDDVAYELNLDIKRGAYLAPGESSAVISGSPADKAELKEKDIITKVNGITIDDKTSLSSALSRFQVGDKVTLTVIRDGKTIKVEVTLEEAPSN
jgi:serine protease Do